MKFNEMKNEILQNPEVLEEYNNLKPEYDIINTILTARKEMQISQEELALKTGILQSDIDEIESGTINPTVDMCTAPPHKGVHHCSTERAPFYRLLPTRERTSRGLYLLQTPPDT